MTITRQEIEDFLYNEAELLDEWKMKEWVALFTENGTYAVPPIGSPNANPLSSTPSIRLPIFDTLGTTNWSVGFLNVC